MAPVVSRLIRFKILALVAAGLILPRVVPAQLQFDHIGYRQGLDNSSASSILQDTAGFLWFGTQAGLQRYDGYEMKLFTSEPFNPNSLSHQLVQTLFLDPDGIIWAGTYGGLNRLDDRSGTISHFRHSSDDPDSLSNDVVVSVARDRRGTLWVGTLDGLNRLDSEADGTFTRFHADSDDPQSLPHNTVRRVFSDSAGRLWDGTYGGLSLVEQDDNGGVTFQTTAAGPEGLPSAFVMSIDEDHDGHLWIGMWDGGVSRMAPDGRFVAHYRFPDNRVYQVLPSRSGIVYAGTWGGGLMVLDPDSGAYTTYTHDPEDSSSIAHNIVYSLFEDRAGVIWIGTNGNGISKLNPGRHDFRFIYPELPAEKRLGTGRVQLLFEDPRTGLLFIGIQNEGLNVRDPETGLVTIHAHDPENPASIGHNNVTSILPDSDNSLLVGTNAGIFRFSPETGTFESGWEPFAGHISPPPIVYSLMRDREGSLWVGTYDHGLLRLLPDGRVHHYRATPGNPHSLSNNLVYNLFEDSLGVIWVSTNGGLNRYVPGTDGFHRYIHDPSDPGSIASNSVSRVIEDSCGTIWIATRSGGLVRYDRETSAFSYIDTTGGLTSNLVASFLETEPGVLHVATTNGMNRVQIDTLSVSRIDERDGLSIREFAGGSTTTANGDHLFGAFSAIVRIPPTPDPSTGTPPLVQITGIRVMNEPYRPSRSAHAIGEIELPHTRNFIEFSFAAMDFSLPMGNRYRYRMIGVDGDWVDAGHRRVAGYTQLAPGNYTFEVLGADSGGAWSHTPARVTVRILPPFWRTPWFSAGILILLGLVAWLSITLRTRSLRLQTQLLESQVAERTEELIRANSELQQVNATRDRFFSIIAHDLRGPISGMAHMMDTVVNDFSTFDRDQLQEISTVVSASASGLESMLENLLEWSQLHLGSIELKSECIPVDEMVTSVFDAHRGIAHTKSVTLVSACPASVRACVDSHGIRTIIANLVNNAIKFTRSGGSVTVSAGVEKTPDGSRTIITIQDSGVGISESKLAELFGGSRVHRTTGTAGEKGTGLGLTLCRDIAERMNGSMRIESIEGTGTTVTVDFPWCDSTT